MQNQDFKRHQCFAGELLDVDNSLGEIGIGVIDIDQADYAAKHAHRDEQCGFWRGLAEEGRQGEVRAALLYRAKKIAVALNGGFQYRRLRERQLELVEARNRLTFFRRTPAGHLAGHYHEQCCPCIVCSEVGDNCIRDIIAIRNTLTSAWAVAGQGDLFFVQLFDQVIVELFDDLGRFFFFEICYSRVRPLVDQLRSRFA